MTKELRPLGFDRNPNDAIVGGVCDLEGLPAGAGRCRSMARFAAGMADRVLRGGRGWDDGRGLPVTPEPLGM